MRVKQQSGSVVVRGFSGHRSIVCANVSLGQHGSLSSIDDLVYRSLVNFVGGAWEDLVRLQLANGNQGARPR